MSQQDKTRPRQPNQAMVTDPGPNLNLPTLLGKENHDPRSIHRKLPAYSFGIKHGKVYDDSSPGPAYYPQPRITRDGFGGEPQYSLYGRQNDTIRFKTPGPGTYNPGNGGSQVPGASNAPKYSLGSRHKFRHRDYEPAPNSYSLPALLGRTTVSGKKSVPIISLGRPRRNVGVFTEDLAKAPGPRAYSTVDPSTYRNKRPMYSMTGRNTMPGDSTQKPGPGAYSPEKAPGPGAYSTVDTNTYKNKLPAYSMAGRNTMPSDNTQKPGPGAYSPEKVSINKPCAPKFSFGSRHWDYIAPLRYY